MNVFDSLDKMTSKGKLGRREFIALGAAGVLTYAYSASRLPKIVQAVASSPADKSGQVTIVQFSDSGQRLKAVHFAKVVKTEAEWQKQLTPAAFDITRHADTELAYSGQYWNLHEKGLFRCICCGNALFSSDTKFDSGTGWPSFWAPVAAQNVYTTRDISLGMVRDAVSCTLCDAHLGHVFDDGPQPTGLRYCMNSASLRFVKHT
ncbi:MAG: peptide-methionine (R)-S-oxide reductase MsrB [Terriglobales bacterium]